VAGLGIFALVYVEARYVVPFFLLIWMTLFAGLRFPSTRPVQQLVAALALATALTLCTGTTWLAGRALFRAVNPQPFVNWEVAKGLERIDVHTGDRVSSIGYAFDAYWAHLAGVRIVAEITGWDAPSFWTSPAPIQSQVFACFASTGAKIVVTDQEPPLGAGEGWQRIGQTNYFVHELGPVLAKNQSAKQ